MTLKIQVVTAAGARLDNSALISRLADQWRDAGHEVIVGPVDRLDAVFLSAELADDHDRPKPATSGGEGPFPSGIRPLDVHAHG